MFVNNFVALNVHKLCFNNRLSSYYYYLILPNDNFFKCDCDDIFLQLLLLEKKDFLRS
jgi:hypothetical protein